MKSATLYGLLAGPLLAGTALAQEVHEEAEQPFILSMDPGAAIWNLLMFIALLWVLGKFVWPHILQGLQAREEKIRGDIESAEAANAKAQQTLDEYKKQLADAHAEARGLIDQARSDAEAVRQRMVADTETEIAQIRRRATDEIDQAKHAALRDLYAQAGDLAVAVASKILQRQVTEEDTARLIDQSLEELDKLDQAG